MAFPQDRLGTVVQLKINGTWTDVVRYDTSTKIGQDGGVSITRGQGGLQDKTPASTARWIWHDPNGVYNNENPRSPYYGLLPLNTPVRVYVPRGDVAANFVGAVTIGSLFAPSACWTADSAALSVTGDIDIRIDVDLARLRRTISAQLLVGKYITSGNQRSWMFYITASGALRYRWSANGTATVAVISSTVAVPTTGRYSFRVTHDVDNGAAGNDVRFYTADTLGGSYTQLGATVTTAGTTSIFNSTAGVEIGALNSSLGPGLVELGAGVTGVTPLVGRVYGFQLQDGIAGSTVASPDFTAQAVGTTSFNDAQGNTWALDNATRDVFTQTPGVEITNADYRFYGQLSSLSQKANKSHSGTGIDVRTTASASGLIQLLSANEAPLQSPISYAFRSYSANGWWPGEDATAADTTEASSGLTDAAPAVISDITFAGYDATLAGSAGVMVCGSTGPSFIGTCKAVASTGRCSFVGYFKFPSIPLSEQTMYSIYSDTGTVRKWTINVSATTYTVRGFNSAGTEIVTKDSLHGVGTEPTNWIAFYLSITQSGANVTPIETEWFAVGTDTFFSQTVIGTTTYAGSTGIFNKVTVQGVAALADVRFAHPLTSTLTTFNFFDTDLTFSKFSRAFAGETGDARFIRVCNLLGIDPVITGLGSTCEEMGAQPIATPMDILYQIPACDGGVLTECIDQLALEYRPRQSLYNQYGLALTWAQLSVGIEVAPDNTDVANDITLTRDNGGSARAVLEYGPYSIQAPPNGIYRVPDGPPVNNYLDSRLPALAQHQLTVRTWPTPRYPSLVVELHRSPFTASASLALLAQKTMLTDLVTITALPTFMAPEPIYLMVKGSIEELNAHSRTITWAMIPYGPYRTSELGTGSQESYKFQAAHDTIEGVVQTQLNADCTSSATQIVANTLTGATIDPALVSMVIKIGGERMTVLEASEIGSVAIDLGQFEITIANFTAAGGSYTQSTTQSHGGTHSGLITVSGSPTQATLRTVNAVRPVIVAGETYRLTYWIYSSIASANVNCVINWQNSGGGAISSSGSALVSIAANTWTKVTNTAVAPALSTQCTYGPTMAGSPANGTLIYFDGIDIAKTTNVVGQPQTLAVTRGIDSYSAAHTAGDYIYVDPTLKARL